MNSQLNNYSNLPPRHLYVLQFPWLTTSLSIKCMKNHLNYNLFYNSSFLIIFICQDTSCKALPWLSISKTLHSHDSTSLWLTTAIINHLLNSPSLLRTIYMSNRLSDSPFHSLDICCFYSLFIWLTTAMSYLFLDSPPLKLVND